MNSRLTALDFITACLKTTKGTPERDEILLSTLAAGHLDWQIILDIVDYQKIAPAFWVALRDRKLIDYLPSKVRECLFKKYLFNTFKNKYFKEQAIKVIRQFNSIGVEPILLKGSASLFVKTFDDPGSRVMVDLDILVPKKTAEGCWNALLALGYLPIEDNLHYHIDYGSHHHLRPLYHPSGHGTIEVHQDAIPNSVATILPTKLIWEQAEPVINEWGIAMSVPSPTHRILHNFLHSEFINQTYARGKISLRSLYELVMVQGFFNEKIDWEMIKQLISRNGREKVLCAWLYLAHRLFGNPMPDSVHPTFGALIHYARTRLQFSWDWTNQIVDRAFWFSTQSICERYHCDDGFWAIAKGRFRLAAYLAGKRGSRALHWFRGQARTGHP